MQYNMHMYLHERVMRGEQYGLQELWQFITR
jgi:hypothetical protein